MRHAMLRVEDVRDVDSPNAERIRYERAVAAPPQHFRAHQRCAKLPGQLEQFIHALRRIQRCPYGRR